MAPLIPDRWEAYRPVGKQIQGTRFIAFKVPLREKVAAMAKNDARLSVNSLIKNVPELGMIIDLTNTNRYYDPSFFTDHGIRYKKIMVPGHEIPEKRFVREFKNAVLDFLNENLDNSKLIGVHCTHGVNRTGYLICNYMVSEMKIEPKTTIDLFGSARGHHIERKNYLNDLHRLETARPENCWRSSAHVDHRKRIPVLNQFKDHTYKRNSVRHMPHSRDRYSVSRIRPMSHNRYINRGSISTYSSNSTSGQDIDSNWRHSTSPNRESSGGLHRNNGPSQEY